MTFSPPSLPSDEAHSFIRALSRIVGWLYFLAWSVSFYPQAVMNQRRRSTAGFSFDYAFTNVLGFLAYTVSTGALVYSPAIRRQYAERHPAAPHSTMQVNDFVYSAHATLASGILMTQFWSRLWGYKPWAPGQTGGSGLMYVVSALNVLAIVAVVVVVLVDGRDGGYDASRWAWIDVIYTCGHVKVILTVVKYIPQAWINYKRQSTVGFSITVILLDFAGGVLSVVQLLIDSSMAADWSGFTSNSAKFALGNVSLLFDLFFMLQHYVLYRQREPEGGGAGEEEERQPTERDPLLPQGSRQE